MHVVDKRGSNEPAKIQLNYTAKRNRYAVQLSIIHDKLVNVQRLPE